MSFRTFIALLWPGLPELWRRGAPAAIGLALGFGLVLNVCIITTWIWTEVLIGGMRGAAWVALAGIWLVGVRQNARFLQNLAYISARAAEPDLFPKAQIEYLQGNWFEAENLVRDMLERNPSDVEAHLLWIALLRRTEHVEEALDCVRHVRTLIGGGRWVLELAREEQSLRAMQADDDAANGTSRGPADLATPTLLKLVA